MEKYLEWFLGQSTNFRRVVLGLRCLCLCQRQAESPSKGEHWKGCQGSPLLLSHGAKVGKPTCFPSLRKFTRTVFSEAKSLLTSQTWGIGEYLVKVEENSKEIHQALNTCAALAYLRANLVLL